MVGASFFTLAPGRTSGVVRYGCEAKKMRLISGILANLRLCLCQNNVQTFGSLTNEYGLCISSINK